MSDAAHSNHSPPSSQTEPVWQVSVLNDSVNYASYICYMLMHELDMSQAEAEQFTLTVNDHGRATVFTGSESAAQRLVTRFHGYGALAVVSQVLPREEVH